MKDFIELLVKEYGLPNFFASYIMLAFYLIIGLITIFKAIQAFRLFFRKRFLRKSIDQDLHPYFTHQEIFNYTKYYIPQYFQNIAPSEGEEMGRIHAAAARSKLMREFLKKGLLTESPIKYFIILSDTGMGKTAFLINLYRKYKAMNRKAGLALYDINLFPLGSKNALNDIKAIENKKSTILLLDAFDEDIKAVTDYRARMVEILEEVKDFRKVIFTCRTQFFPTKDEEPSDTNDITFGENIRHSIHKLYLSAFDNKDVLKYLLNKYELQLFKLYRAYELVNKCPSLMFRPMLLTYIDDLIEGKTFYEYSFEMYHVMIDRWVIRESQKPGIRERHDGMYTYAEKLWNFSLELAVNLYTEREKRQGYSLSIEELKKLLGRRSIGSVVLSLGDSTGRSLLNRNSVGMFKFAHKSILEYFLARHIFNHPQFLYDFDFHGMDATQTFHYEMLANMLKNNEGKFQLKNEQKFRNLSSINTQLIKSLEFITITKMGQIKAESFAGLGHLKTLIIANGGLFPIYLLYTYIYIDKNTKNTSTANPLNRTFTSFIDLYSEIARDVARTIPDLDDKYVLTILDNCEMDKNIKAELYKFINSDSLRDDNPNKTLDKIREVFIGGKSERAIIIEAYESFKTLKKIKSFLPNTKTYF